LIKEIVSDNNDILEEIKNHLVRAMSQNIQTIKTPELLKLIHRQGFTSVNMGILVDMVTQSGFAVSADHEEIVLTDQVENDDFIDEPEEDPDAEFSVGDIADDEAEENLGIDDDDER